MIHYRSDRSNEPIPHDECSTLRLDGPLKHMLGRSVVHLTKAEAKSLSAWIGVVVNRPDLPEVPGPDYLDGDATSPDALRVRAIEKGTAARSRPPRPGPGK